MVIPVVKNLWEEYKIREFKFLSKRFLPPSSGVKKRLNPYSPGYKYIMGHLILYPSYEVFTTGIIIKDIHTCRLIHYAKAMNVSFQSRPLSVFSMYCDKVSYTYTLFFSLSA